ncbi:hypothetical protein SAMN05444157_0506 [Frankineae bacterium MT45]|nr:hypothetical protein SAMN05444157_0506 [Frankineae bacterium MT45]
MTPFRARQASLRCASLRRASLWRASRMVLGAVVSISATTTAAVYLSATGASALGTSDAPNPVQVGYDCVFPGSTTHSITALVAWSAGPSGGGPSSAPSSGVGGGAAADSALRLTSVSLVLSADVVDELRQLHAVSVGGVFGPQVSATAPTSPPPTTSTLASLMALPSNPGTPLALVGGWLAGAPTYSYSSSASYSLRADTFVLQLAAATADGSSVTLPASVTCTTTAGRDNTIFTHSPHVCSGSSAAPGDGCVVASPKPAATPTPRNAPTPTPVKPATSPTPAPRTSVGAAPPAVVPKVVATAYSLNGTFTLPSVSGAGRLGPGTLRVRPAAADGSFTGTLTVPPAVIEGTLFGFVPITVTAAFTPVGAVTGRVSANLSATADSIFSVSLKSVKLFGLLPVTSSGCRTKSPVTLHLASGGAGTFDPTTGGGLSGQLSIGEFTGCGAATAALNAVVPGAGSSVSFSVLRP